MVSALLILLIKMKKMKRKTKYLIIAVLAIVVVLFSSLYIYDMEINAPPRPPTSFVVDLTIQKVNGEYHLRCDYIPDGVMNKYNLELSNLEVTLWDHGTMIFNSSLSDLVDNESSQVVFYDNDSDGRLSVGDLFIVRGVGTGTVFRIAPNGRGGCLETLY